MYIKNENAVIFQTLHYAKIAFSYIKFICSLYVCIYSCMEIEKKNTDAEYNRLVNAQEIEIFK